MKLDAKYVRSKLYVKGTTVMSTVPCKIHIPKDFSDRGLANIDKVATIIGLFAIIIDDKYLVINKAIMFTATYSTLTTTTIDEVIYYEFGFDANTPIFELVAVQAPFMTIEILTYVGIMAHVPYYCEADTILRILQDMGSTCGVWVDKDPAIMELILSVGQRVEGEDKTLWRHAKPNQKWKQRRLTDISIRTSSNFSRLLGSYQWEGLMESIVDTDKAKPNKLETILRS